MIYHTVNDDGLRAARKTRVTDNFAAAAALTICAYRKTSDIDVQCPARRDLLGRLELQQTATTGHVGSTGVIGTRIFGGQDDNTARMGSSDTQRADTRQMGNRTVGCGKHKLIFWSGGTRGPTRKKSDTNSNNEQNKRFNANNFRQYDYGRDETGCWWQRDDGRREGGRVEKFVRECSKQSITVVHKHTPPMEGAASHHRCSGKRGVAVDDDGSGLLNVKLYLSLCTKKLRKEQKHNINQIGVHL